MGSIARHESYHGENGQLNIDLLHQLRHREIPIPNGPIQRGRPAIAQNLTTRHHNHRRHRRSVTLQ